MNFANLYFTEEWFTRKISIGLENGQELDDIEIDYCLSVLKPLHATWLISLYDHMSSPEGKAVIASGWKSFFDAINLGLSGLPMLDPFNDICPLIKVIPFKETLSLASLCPQELESYKAKVADETNVDESEWEVDVTRQVMIPIRRILMATT